MICAVELASSEAAVLSDTGYMRSWLYVLVQVLHVKRCSNQSSPATFTFREGALTGKSSECHYNNNKPCLDMTN